MVYLVVAHMVLAVLNRKLAILISYHSSIFDIVEWNFFFNFGNLINKIS